MLKPQIISEVSVRYRARSSRFFPAVLGQARPPSIDARRSISVVVLSCSVLQGGAPRINSEVSIRYRTGSSQFFPAVRCDVDVRLCALLRPFGVCISRVNHPRVRLGSGLVTAALATTASAAPAAAVMSTDEAAAKAAYLARLEAESPFYTKKRGVTGAARASAVASMASSGSLSAATITEEAVAKATYLARMEAESSKRQGAVDSGLATTASAAPASAVMSTDEAAAKAAYPARMEAESPFYTKKQIAAGSPRPRLHQGPQLRP